MIIITTRGPPHTITASLEHPYYCRPYYHSISRPLRSPAAIWHRCREIATNRSPPCRSAADRVLPTAVQTPSKIFGCTPCSPAVRRENLLTRSVRAPAECVFPRHWVLATPPNPAAARAPHAQMVAGPRHGSLSVRQRRQCRTSATTESTRSRSRSSSFD